MNEDKILQAQIDDIHRQLQSLSRVVVNHEKLFEDLKVEASTTEEDREMFPFILRGAYNQKENRIKMDNKSMKLLAWGTLVIQAVGTVGFHFIK